MGGGVGSEPGSIPGDSWFTGTGSDGQTGCWGGLGGGKGTGTAWPGWEDAWTPPDGGTCLGRPSKVVLGLVAQSFGQVHGAAGHPRVR